MKHATFIIMMFTLALSSILPITTAQAGKEYGPYSAQVERIIDGDTFTATTHIWPRLNAQAYIRLDGIDAPELHGKCTAEKNHARAAREYLRGLISGKTVTLKNVFQGKYAGRVIATVMLDGININQVMISAGMARTYHGGKRQSWCNQ